MIEIKLPAFVFVFFWARSTVDSTFAPGLGHYPTTFKLTTVKSNIYEKSGTFWEYKRSQYFCDTCTQNGHSFICVDLPGQTFYYLTLGIVWRRFVGRMSSMAQIPGYPYNTVFLVLHNCSLQSFNTPLHCIRQGLSTLREGLPLYVFGKLARSHAGLRTFLFFYE